MNTYNRLLLTIAFLLILVSISTWAALTGVSNVVPPPTRTPIPLTITTPNWNAEAEYYRGIYDVCVQYGLRGNRRLATVSDACRDYVRRLVVKRWYYGRSPGWEWPIKLKGEGG